MKEKMTNGTLMDSNLFLNFLQSLGASCSRPFFFPPLVLSRPVFEVSFLLFTMVLNLFWREIPWAEFSGKRISTPFCSKFIFIPSCLNKNFMESTPPCSVGKKKNLLLP